MLNETILQALQPQPKIYQAADGDGLFIRVSPAGLKSFYYEFRHNGRKVRGTLGQWPAMSLNQARAAVQEVKQQAQQSEQAGPMESFASAFARWFEMKRPRLKASSVVIYETSARLHLLPALGKTPLINITAPFLIKTLTPLHNAGNVTAVTRSLQLVNVVLDWAVNAGALPYNPCRRVTAYFTSPPHQHRPTRPAADLPLIFAQVFSKAPRPSSELCFLFTVSSLLRVKECACLQWDMYDPERQIITVPAGLMKGGRQHRVPVSSFLAELLQAAETLQLEGETPYIFPATRRDAGHVCTDTANRMLAAVKDGKMVAHGFRAMARSWMADEGVDYDVAEDCLAHVTGTQVSRAYQRHDFLERRRPVMEKWGEIVRAAYMECPGVLLKRISS